MRDPELKEALEDVLAHRQGKHALSQRTTTFEPSQIQAIRLRTDSSSRRICRALWRKHTHSSTMGTRTPPTSRVCTCPPQSDRT